MSPNQAAQERYNQAAMLHNKGLEIGTVDSALTYKFFASAAEADPTFKEAWYSTGNCNQELGLRAAAVACFRRAVELDPKDAKAWTNLGHCLYHMGRLDEAREALGMAISLEPEFGFPYVNLSLIDSLEGHLDRSLGYANKGFALEPEPVSEMALAFAHLYKRHWTSGLRHLEARFPYKLKHWEKFPYPRWQGEPFFDKVLYLPAEQGMGDALSFLRFVPLAAERGGQIFLQTQPELVRMAANMLAPYRNVLVGPLSAVLPPADYVLSITSLPVALALTDQEIERQPGLAVPYKPLGATSEWKVPNRRLHVGIVWAGAPDNGIDIWRSMKVTQFLELYRCPGIQLYSLQIGPRAMDLHETGCGPLIKDMAPYIRDTMDTAAAIRELDLVIAVETSIGHICGAIGADCWTLYAYNGGDWRHGRNPEQDGVLWYPNTRVFKQGRDAEWQPVLDRVIPALRERVGA